MEHIRKEIRMFLVSAKDDFEFERQITHEFVVPQIRYYCMNRYNIDFILIDPHLGGHGMHIPQVDTSSFINAQRECQKVSDGPCCLIFSGQKWGGGAPTVIAQAHYVAFLKILKDSNNLNWTVFQNKYIIDNSSNPPVYRLVKSGTSIEESESIISALNEAIAAAVKVGSFKQNDLLDYTRSDYERYGQTVLIERKSWEKTLGVVRNFRDMENIKEPLKSKVLDTNKIGAIDPNKHKKACDLKDKLVKCLTKETCFRFSISSDLSTQLSDISIQKAKAKSPSNNVINSLNRDDVKPDLLPEDYLAGFAAALLDRLKKLIDKCIHKREFFDIPQFKEIETHISMFEETLSQPKPLKDREREIKVISNYLTSVAQIPGLLHGRIGCGKSALLRAIWKKIPELLPKTKPVIVVRCCGNTCSSATLQTLLASLTEQILTAFKKPTVNTKSCEYAGCVYEFWQAINLASASQPIIVLMDNVEKLYPVSHTELFRWLPHHLPNFVKFLVTSSSESILNGFKHRYEESSVITIPGLDVNSTLQQFMRGLKLEDKAAEVITGLIQENSNPLYVKLLGEVISLTETEKLPDRPKLLFMKRIEGMEMKYPAWLVKYVLVHLASSRFGLSLSELQDLLALENTVIKESGFNLKGNSIFAIPYHFQMVILNEVSDYLVFVQIDDRYVITFRHDAFKDAICDYYQVTKEFGNSVHLSHAEYWQSRYCFGKPKPLFDKSVDSMEKVTINIERCAAKQLYFWTADGIKTSRVMSSGRKLAELPFHLLKADRIADIYKQVVFCYEYLYSKLTVSTVNDLIAEMYFLRQAYEIKNNQELETVISLLRLIAPTLDSDPELIGPELTGRLSHLIGRQPLITGMLQQVDFAGVSVNALIPSIPCYPIVDSEAIRVDLPPTASTYGVVCGMSPDNRFFTTLLPGGAERDLVIIVWDTKSATKSQIINLGKHPEKRFECLFYMPQRDEHVLLQYYTGKEMGFLFINMDYSTIETSLVFPLSMNPKLVYLARSYLTIHINNMYKVYVHPSGKETSDFKTLSWPFIITPSDKYCVAPKAKSKNEASCKSETDLRLLNVSSGANLATMTCPLSASYITATTKNDTLFVGTKTHGIVYVYDIGLVAKRDLKKMKQSMELSIAEQELDNDLKDLIKRYQAMIKILKMDISYDDKSLIVVYNLNDIKNIYAIWNLVTKNITAVFPQISGNIVRFSHDSTHVYQFVPNKPTATSVIVYSTAGNWDPMETNLRAAIQDFHVMKGGAVLMVVNLKVVLTTLKYLDKQMADLSCDLTGFCVALTRPQFTSELNIIYSNNIRTSEFQYYNMDHNTLITADMSHSCPGLLPNPLERYISPDGTKLIFMHNSEPNEEMKCERRKSVTEYIMDINFSGHLIRSHTDFRKPEIPSINYYTGFPKSGEQDSGKITSNIIYKQRILRVYDLDTGCNICQISLTGEKVLKLTNEYLFTFKPDYASMMRPHQTFNVGPHAVGSNDIISIYDLTTGLFERDIRFEHPLIAADLVDSNTKLMVSCGFQGKWLRLYGGEYMQDIIYEVDMESLMRHNDEYARLVNIRNLSVFQGTHNFGLVSYYWKDPEKEFYCAKVDLAKRDLVSHFQMFEPVQDVSPDGTYCIDSYLRVYDLNKGELVRKLTPPLAQDSDRLHCQPRFTHDGAYVIVLDNERNCLSVIRNDTMAFIVGKCLLHRIFPYIKNLSPFSIKLSHGGNIIVLQNEAEFKIFILRGLIPMPGARMSIPAGKTARQKPVEMPSYNNILQRVRYLMPHTNYNQVDAGFQLLGSPVHQCREPDTNKETSTKSTNKNVRIKNGKAAQKEDDSVSRTPGFFFEPCPVKMELTPA